MKSVGIGIVGCGNVFDIYMRGLISDSHVRVVRCADIDLARAREAAGRHNIPAHGTVDELLQDPGVEVVVNLTPPTVHMEVTEAALKAGKHVYSEKPLALDLDSVRKAIALAGTTGRRLGAAPDTFLGGAAQTARAVLDEGRIGAPVAATAFFVHHRAESWHPDPTHLFKPGGGPVLDLGPYYISLLVSCLGPVAEVASMSHTGQKRRVVTAPNRRVEVVEAEVATHSAALLRFVSGAVCVVQLSFDVWDAHLPFVEIYGTKGAMSLADPNGYDGDVLIKMKEGTSWDPVSPVMPPQAAHGSGDQFRRGLGVADLATAIRTGVPHSTGPDFVYHVLEVLLAIETSERSAAVTQIASRCERPRSMANTAAHA
ncbi:Gfo/Idh/MocA family oxidoreductase [Streptomyces sp. NPDC001137]|uniref:Gfo/Idh/MocA family protein n=1 Tax=Streptomyces sp. NPDC001137 TaxID=3154378 RepID=UPI00331A350D